jgi:hypothetical protein
MCQNFDLRFLLFLFPFYQVFFRPFSLFWLSILLSFLLFLSWFFIAHCFSLLFCSCFVPVFLAHVVSSLAYSNLHRIKDLVVVDYVQLARRKCHNTYYGPLGRKPISGIKQKIWKSNFTRSPKVISEQNSVQHSPKSQPMRKLHKHLVKGAGAREEHAGKRRTESG